MIETGRRHCKNGYTVIYRIVLERATAATSPQSTSNTVCSPTSKWSRFRAATTIRSPSDSFAGAGFPPQHECAEASVARSCHQCFDSAGFTRSKVCFSDNLFQSQHWQGYIENIRAKREEAQVASADHKTRLACWISDSYPMCKHITPKRGRLRWIGA